MLYAYEHDVREQRSVEIRIERDSDIPLYMQIAEQIRVAVLRGDIADGQRLPPERRLAEQLGINRTTVVNAYRELAASGIVEGHVGRGTIITSVRGEDSQSPAVRPMAWGQHFVRQPQWAHATLVQEAADLAAQPGIISLAGGIPAPQLYPLDAFRQGCDDFLRKGSLDLLANCPTEGFLPLRQWLADWVGSHGIDASAHHILITSGSTQGIDLIARLLVEQDDEVVIENPTSLGIRQCFSSLRARTIGIPLDSDGMRVDVLRDVLNHHRPKLIYTLPTFQNPTGVSLSTARRAELIGIARERGIPIVEDDPYSDLSYGTPPPAPLKALDEGGHVIYIGTFSKVLFPGLRLGWVVAAEPVVQQLARLKRNVDLFSSTLAQGSLWYFLREFDWQEHLRKLCTTYRQRRDGMIAALRRHCPPGLHWETPAGGFYFWVQLPENVPARELLAEAQRSGVAFLPGEPFCDDNEGQHAIRLNFSYVELPDIERGIRRLGEAISNVLERRQGESVPPPATRAIV